MQVDMRRELQKLIDREIQLEEERRLEAAREDLSLQNIEENEAVSSQDQNEQDVNAPSTDELQAETVEQAARTEFLPITPKPTKGKWSESQRRSLKWIILLLVLIVAAALVFSLTHRVMVLSEGETDGIGQGRSVIYSPFAKTYRGETIVTRDGMVGRVVAIEGEWVFVDDEQGRLFINTYLVQELYDVRHGSSGESMGHAIQVPADTVYLMGDDRTQDHGMLVSLDDLLGVVIWPLR